MGPCAKCLRPMTRNPHPNAGDPKTLLTVGCVYECIPCLVTSRHEWCERALRAEKLARSLELGRDALSHRRACSSLAAISLPDPNCPLCVFNVAAAKD